MVAGAAIVVASGGTALPVFFFAAGAGGAIGDAIGNKVNDEIANPKKGFYNKHPHFIPDFKPTATGPIESSWIFRPRKSEGTTQ
jgi:hypothetical protein